MKAYVLEGIDDLRYRETDYPGCPEGWTIVQVKAAGVCSSDIPRIFTKGTYHFPTIPGHEFSGIVVEGRGPEAERWVGKRVGIFPLIPCKTCPQCRERRYEMCADYDYVGSRRDGGFAEYVAVPAWNLIALPESVAYQQAAMLEPLSVALHAMKRANIKPGDTVGIVGTGMIGFAAAQWAGMLGASKVYVVGRSEAKRSLAEQLSGVTYVLDRELKELPGMDVTVEAVGTSAALEMAVSALKPGGTAVLMGNPAGDMTLKQDVYWKILRKQLVLVGTWNSSYESSARCNWTEAVEALASGKVQVDGLISHTFDQEHLPEGLALMKSHREPYCKIMTLWNEKREADR